ncbi:DUF1989 domain-containing protein [Nocardia cyriacigeorgica]|nr:urea carboxylase-associated family protein [Nocardia cyriacigeorgica]
MQLLDVHVPAYTGRSILVREGQLVTITDVEGQQVGDMWAIDAADPGCWLSVSHTRDRLERLFPKLGQSFTDQRGVPILEYTADSSPGKHDMLFAPCDRWLYEAEGLVDHPNCRDNFLSSAKELGIDLGQVPDPVNLFQNSSPSPEGDLQVHPAASAAGDAVTFRAHRTIHVIVSACSVDYWPTNGDRCTSLNLQTKVSS